MTIKDFIGKKLLNNGRTSKCFLLQNGNIFKQFNNPLSILDIERFKYYLNYKNENFLFPFDFIYDYKKFYGYITKRAQGKTLKEIFSYSDLNKLSTDSKKLEYNIDYVSNAKIVMHDFHSENIMYDGNLLQVIDVDEYGIRDFYETNDIKEINFKYCRTLIGNLFITNIQGIVNEHSNYIIDKINCYKYTGYKASEIVLKTKEEMEKYTKESINTVDEFKKIIKR